MQQMRLRVTGMNTANERFKHLWGRYLLGFKPWNHCIQSFETKVARGISPGMSDCEIELRNDFELFYLCGVGLKPSMRRETNVHLAVRPCPGSVASVGSLYGVCFTIQNAQAISILPLAEGWRGLPPAHVRCKNFQFGYQMFDVAEVGDAAPREVVRKLRDGRSLQRCA